MALTQRQGKTIAVAVIIAAGMAVVLLGVIGRQHKVVRDAGPNDLTPGPSQVVFTTSKGTLVFDLYPQLAPKHVAQFLKLTEAGVYTGSTVMRIEKNFVVQIDAVYARPEPMTTEQQALVANIPAEFTNVNHKRRTLSMARYDDFDSAQASFSIVLVPSPHMDGNYTVFGEMREESEPTLKAIEAVPVIEGTTKPVEVFKVTKAEVRPRT